MIEVPRGRAVGWGVLVTALVAVAYLARAAGGKPDPDVLYRWSTAAGGLVEYAVVAGVLALLVRGLDWQALLGWVAPGSWPRALGLAGVGLAGIWVVGVALSPFLNAGKDQGLVPSRWESSHAAPFVANFLVIAVVAPLVEESVYRGFGMTAVGSVLGTAWAVVVTALAFGLAHGLVAGLPVLVAFGAIVASIRARTGSVFPGMLTHGLFNASSLLLAVTVGTHT